MEIVLSIITSIIASLIMWGFSQLYSFDTRRKVEYKLMLLRNDNYDYQKFLEYKDYDLALTQVQRMLDEVCDLYSYIKLLTYSYKKRKLIYTLLNSLHYVLSRFQRYYEGYDGNLEKESCCEEGKRHLYVVGYKQTEKNKYPDPNNFQSVSEVTIELLSELNTYKAVRRVLKEGMCFYGHRDIAVLKKYYMDLVDVNSFRDSLSKCIIHKFTLTSTTMTRKAYEKLIESL